MSQEERRNFSTFGQRTGKPEETFEDVSGAS
jgi:hypothetical protein